MGEAIANALLDEEILIVPIGIAPEYEGRRACCGEQWTIMEVRYREAKWWAFMACPACGALRCLPLFVPRGIVLRVTDQGLMASTSYATDWQRVRFAWGRGKRDLAD